MSRPLRIEYPGAVYHVTCRGNERKSIFRDDKDRNRFLEILQQSIKIYNITVYSYILMLNHFHILVKTPLGNLGQFMRHFNISYIIYFNRRHRRVGHLYQGRYKSMVIDTDEYLSMVSRYIHLNPVRVVDMKGKSPEEKIKYLRSYKWSSFPGYIKKKEMKSFVDYEPILIENGGLNTNGRREYQRVIYSNITNGIEIKDKIVEQSILGDESFVEWIKEKVIPKKPDRECPQLSKLQKYKAKETIINAVEKETGKNIELIIKERGTIRQIAMDLLYRLGGMKSMTIGEMFGVDYSTVSQGRKRLREKMLKDKTINKLIMSIERDLSILKN